MNFFRSLPAVVVFAASGFSPLLAVVPTITFKKSFGSNGSSDGQFNFPFGIATNADKIYVADFQNNRVERFGSGGSFQKKWGAAGAGNGQLNGPGGVAVRTSGGQIYVTDIRNNRVQRFDSNGTFLSTWGSFGFGAGQFNSPTGIAINQGTGDVYVCEQGGNNLPGGNRVQRFSSTGGYLGQWGSAGSGSGQFNAPDGIAVNPKTGQVYVSEFNGNRIQRFSATGAFETKWGSSGSSSGKFNNPVGLSVDPNGKRVYVADAGNSRVQVFDLDGKFITSFGSSGSGNAQFNRPYGVAFASDTLVNIIDNGNNRVSQWQISNVVKTPPVVTIAGRPKRKTFDRGATIAGTVSRPRGTTKITAIKVVVGRRIYSLKGAQTWFLRVRLKVGTNRVTVTAKNDSGITSEPVIIKVIRRRPK